ncbi:unnamed protein product [Camellia sinensis]
MYALLWFLSLIGSIWTFIFSSSALGMLELVCWNFGLGVEQVMKLLPRRSFAFLLIFLALGMYALIFVACYLPILRHWRGVLIYISSMVGETSLLLLKFLVSLLLQAIWMVVEDTKGKLYLPLIMLIAFSIIVIVKVKVFVRHDEMGILEEVAASFLRLMFESIEGKNYVEACLCTFPTMIAMLKRSLGGLSHLAINLSINLSIYQVSSINPVTTTPPMNICFFWVHRKYRMNICMCC